MPIDEDHPFNNRTMYGEENRKRANASCLRHHVRDALCCVSLFQRLRSANGHCWRLHGSDDSVVGCDEANQPPLIFGDGKQAMDFIFVDDIARANLMAAQSHVTDEALTSALVYRQA